MPKPIDRAAYRAAPAMLPGMLKGEAVTFLTDNGFPFGISEEDGKGFSLPAIVMIRLSIRDGIVMEADLDGQKFTTTTYVR